MPYPPRAAPPFLVKKILGGTLHHRTIVVADLAEAGMSLYPQAEKLEAALLARRRGPGAVLVYAGHNDAAYSDRTPFWETAREEVFNRSALLRAVFFAAERRFPALRVRTLQTYEYQLRRVVRLARASGLTPILATAASNLADMDPGLPPGAGPGERAVYARFERAGREARRGRKAEAAALYRAVAEARIPDNFGRATAEQNAVVRRVAEDEGVPLVDAEALFARASRLGVPGEDLFIDGQHPNFRGYALLAEAYAEALAAREGVALFEPMTDTPRLLDDLGITRSEQALAQVEAGRWLFSAASRHGRPGYRLDAAAARFRRALVLDPDSFSARVGLALTQAARRPDFLDRNIDWLGARRMFYGAAYELPAADRPELIRRLRASGASPALLEGISAAKGP